jgi:hypothetical protein
MGRIAIANESHAMRMNRRGMLVGGVALGGGLIASQAAAVFAPRGPREDAADINARLAGAKNGDRVVLDRKTYVLDAQIVCKAGIVLDLNGSVLKAADDATYEFLMIVEGASGFRIENGTLDVNGPVRGKATKARKCGLLFMGCTDSEARAVTIRNANGQEGMSGVSASISGKSARCGFRNCVAADAGRAPFNSDGFFISGDHCFAIDCQALRCRDTGFVLESGNYGLIQNCVALDCAAGGGITNASALPSRGNTIRGLKIVNWDASVTGGIMIGVPTPQTGDLLDTVVDATFSIGKGGRGIGPAINIRNLGGGRARGVKLTGSIAGGGTAQGVLVDGNDVTVSMRIEDPAVSCVQFQPGATGQVIGSELIGGTLGVSAGGTARARVTRTSMERQRHYNAYAFEDAQIDLVDCRLGAAGVGHVGNERRARVLLKAS